VKVERKDFGKLLDTERPNGSREAVKETTGIFSVVFTDTFQEAFICLVQALG